MPAIRVRSPAELLNLFYLILTYYSDSSDSTDCDEANNFEVKNLEKEENQTTQSLENSEVTKNSIQEVQEDSNEKPTTSQIAAIPQKRKKDHSSTEVKIPKKVKNPYDYWMA